MTIPSDPTTNLTPSLALTREGVAVIRAGWFCRYLAHRRGNFSRKLALEGAPVSGGRKCFSGTLTFGAFS